MYSCSLLTSALPMMISIKKKLYEPRSKSHFEALEQTCRLRPLGGSEDKYLFEHTFSSKFTVIRRLAYSSTWNTLQCTRPYLDLGARYPLDPLSYRTYSTKFSTHAWHDTCSTSTPFG